MLLQGNHEGPEDLLAHPHDLPQQLNRKYGSEWRTLYKELSRLFRQFHTAVLVKKKCVMLHGGIPSKAVSLEDLAYAYRKHPHESHLEEILWSDPSEQIIRTCASPRGAGKIFGKYITEHFLKIADAPILIRGHEPSKEGYKFNHNNRILTLFSRKGPPYYNQKAAYLQIRLSYEQWTASSLQTKIHRF